MFIGYTIKLLIGDRVLSEGESKIVFLDGDTERVLRGRIISEDDFFITLARRDGTIRIAKNRVIKIDDRGRDGDSDGAL